MKARLLATATIAGLALAALPATAAQASTFPNPCSNPITRCLIRPVCTSHWTGRVEWRTCNGVTVRITPQGKVHPVPR